jgi:hypothetical protein
MIRGLALAPLFALATVSNARAQGSLSVEGTEFVLTTDKGKILRGLDLVGATLHVDVDGKLLNVTLAAAQKDDSARGGALFLYEFVTRDDAGNETALCTPDANGKSLGFPVSDGRGGFELACTSGAVGKCVRWGYRPWEERPKGPPFRSLFAACVHMLRADYGGDGHATAVEGTPVYVCDRFGILPCAKKPPLRFEAAWGANGATCVARPRIPANVSLNQLRRRYPKLKARLGPRVCTDQSAFRDADSILLNRSSGK